MKTNDSFQNLPSLAEYRELIKEMFAIRERNKELIIINNQLSDKLIEHLENKNEILSEKRQNESCIIIPIKGGLLKQLN